MVILETGVTVFDHVSTQVADGVLLVFAAETLGTERVIYGPMKQTTEGDVVETDLGDVVTHVPLSVVEDGTQGENQRSVFVEIVHGLSVGRFPQEVRDGTLVQVLLQSESEPHFRECRHAERGGVLGVVGHHGLVEEGSERLVQGAVDAHGVYFHLSQNDPDVSVVSLVRHFRETFEPVGQKVVETARVQLGGVGEPHGVSGPFARVREPGELVHVRLVHLHAVVLSHASDSFVHESHDFVVHAGRDEEARELGRRGTVPRRVL